MNRKRNKKKKVIRLSVRSIPYGTPWEEKRERERKFLSDAGWRATGGRRDPVIGEDCPILEVPHLTIGL